MKTNVERELELFRKLRSVPSILTKEFASRLDAAERQAVVLILCNELKTAVNKQHARTIGLQVARVNTIRKEKGEL